VPSCDGAGRTLKSRFAACFVHWRVLAFPRPCNSTLPETVSQGLQETAFATSGQVAMLKPLLKSRAR
jgi:hypothetical protein